MKIYSCLDHTADMAIEVYGKDLKSLFQNSAIALFDVMASSLETAHRSEPQEFKIRVEAVNQEELLVRWLGELLSLSDWKRIVFQEFGVQELSERSIRALARGKPRRDYKILTEIKAVTYHELKIKKENGRYTAQIILDV